MFDAQHPLSFFLVMRCQVSVGESPLLHSQSWDLGGIDPTYKSQVGPGRLQSSNFYSLASYWVGDEGITRQKYAGVPGKRSSLLSWTDC